MQDLSIAGSSPLISSDALAPYCKCVQFAVGDVLRRKGQFYREMYLITDGVVSVEVSAKKSGKHRQDLGTGTPIGEIGFLRGSPATANVTAKTKTSVLVINDRTLQSIERQDPDLAIRLSYYLAEVSEVRLTMDSMAFGDGLSLKGSNGIQTVLCRNEDMLHQAGQLRYQVYCEELGRDSPYADHEKKTLRDPLDDFGITFLAIEEGEFIGTIRGNIAREGPLGILEELYGLSHSPHYPDATSICTKYLVKKSKRRGPAALKLVAALVRYGLANGVSECFIDCVPVLWPYYKAFGFKIAGRPFFHYENGLSIPLVLDLEKTGRRLSRNPGMRETLQIYMRARVYRWLESRWPSIPKTDVAET